MKENKNGIGRRNFFKNSGVALGGAVLAAANFGEAMAVLGERECGDGVSFPSSRQSAAGDAISSVCDDHALAR